MKKLIFLILTITSTLFSQGWNTTVETSIDVPNLKTMDSYTNRDGIHIIVQNGYPDYYLKYYLINSSGTVIRSSTFETSSSAVLPNISGNNDKVYVVYKMGSNLETRKSTNAGLSWSNINDLGIGNNTCNGVDIVYGNGGLHVVYAMQDNENYYETYYYKLNSSNQWVDYKNVTDYGSEVGGFTTVSISDNRVHISYNSGTLDDPQSNAGDAMTRDKYYSTWQNPQTIFNLQDGSSRERVHAGNSKLFNFYYKWESGMGNYHADLTVKVRNLNSSNWSSPTLLQSYSEVNEIVSTANTSNGNTHIVYPGFSSVIYRVYNGSSWSSASTIGDDYLAPRISSVSNDLFVVWNKMSSDKIKYRQWDDDPLAPQNLAVQIYTQGNNTYPKLTWSLNNEPDVYIKLNAYEIERRTKCWSQEWGPWSTIGYKNGNQSEYIDYTISGLHAEACTAEYHIRAKDKNDHLSPWSSTVSINFSVFNKLSQDIEKYEYALSQNYPNPFNPSTQISYSLAQDAFVTLKVYDMLGNEVANLVNEKKSAGYYSVDFNASDLPSGIYIYKLTSGNFTESKKLILLK